LTLLGVLPLGGCNYITPRRAGLSTTAGLSCIALTWSKNNIMLQIVQLYDTYITDLHNSKTKQESPAIADKWQHARCSPMPKKCGSFICKPYKGRYALSVCTAVTD